MNLRLRIYLIVYLILLIFATLFPVSFWPYQDNANFIHVSYFQCIFWNHIFFNFRLSSIILTEVIIADFILTLVFVIIYLSFYKYFNKHGEYYANKA
jgi:hypothetical protein